MGSEDHDRELERFRSENAKLREEMITSSKKYYDIGYACAKDMQKDKIEMLLGLLREAHVKMVENDLWVNLRQRVAAAIRESGDE